MKIIAYAFLAILIVILFAVIVILAKSLIKLACLIVLALWVTSILYRINK